MITITVARKPSSQPTTAESVLYNGCGAINIEATRIFTSDNLERPFGGDNKIYDSFKGMQRGEHTGVGLTGRWPSNLILSSSIEVQEMFPIATVGGSGRPYPRKNGASLQLGGVRSEIGYGDTGSSTRFFKCVGE